jgi:hypothetical protein
MVISGSGLGRPVTGLEDLELRRDRLAELIRLQLVSPTLAGQIRRAITQLEQQIADARADAAEPLQRLAA